MGSDDGRGAAMDALKAMRGGASRARGTRPDKRGAIMIEIGLGEPEPGAEGTVAEAEADTESGEMPAEEIDLAGLELEDEEEE